MNLNLNANLERDIARSAGVRAALTAKAQQVAQAAEQTGKQVAASYKVDVNQTADGVQVVASTRGINAASWIEFGTPKLPPAAPLRRGAESAGLNLRARQGGTT